MTFRKSTIVALLLAWSSSSALAVCDDPPGYLGGACRRISDTWSQGQDDLLLPFQAHHLRFAYSKEKIDRLEENAWGIGYERSRFDEEGNWQSLYAMGFRDSHGDFEPAVGYGYQWIWGGQESLHAGLGYTLIVTARRDIGHYVPLPGILPIASVNFRRSGVKMAYVPGGRGNGNVLFLWGSVGF